MGFFKDVRKLNKMGKDTYQQMDVGAQLNQASASMAQAQQFMAQQTAAAQAASQPDGGIPGTGSITAVRPTGMLLNYNPVVELDLLVTPEGRAPYPVTITDSITVVNRMVCVAGRAVPVTVDATDPRTVWVDWTSAAATG
jgi:hypothetical protein